MQNYRITVTQLVPTEQLSKLDDRQDSPAGVYNFDADGREHALDQFHDLVPIACLDDFSIDVETDDMPAIYELTARVANGDDHWTREVCDNYHSAAVAGLDFAARKQGRLVRIERMEAVI